MRQLIFALPLAIAATPGLAADADNKFAADGIGARSCGEFIAALSQPEPLRAFAAWTNGFMTAYNLQTPDTFDITPWQSVQLVVAKMSGFCRNNPNVAYVQGVRALIGTLEAERLTQEDTVVTIRQGESSVLIYTSVLQEVRAELNKAGLDAGAPGTPFAEELIIALTQFQKDKGLPETGLPDITTLNVLFP